MATLRYNPEHTQYEVSSDLGNEWGPDPIPDDGFEVLIEDDSQEILLVTFDNCDLDINGVSLKNKIYRLTEVKATVEEGELDEEEVEPGEPA